MDLETWVAVLGLAVGLPTVFLFNRLKGERRLARDGLAAIEAQLRRRTELVPRLVAAAQSLLPGERALLASLTELHAAAAAAKDCEQRFGRERALGECLARLLALRESNAVLRDDDAFGEAAAQLAAVEAELQYARRYYNGAVTEYMRRMASFPDGLIARLFGFRELPYFETADRREVEVSM
jgi:LemA protein